SLVLSIRAIRCLQLCLGYVSFIYFFSQAVCAQVRVICTERSVKNTAQARELLGRAGLSERVELRIGDALSLFSKEPGPFDIVFCDIDKEGYPDVPAAALPKIRQGGMLIFDNALWFGRVVDDR